MGQHSHKRWHEDQTFPALPGLPRAHNPGTQYATLIGTTWSVLFVQFVSKPTPGFTYHQIHFLPCIFSRRICVADWWRHEELENLSSTSGSNLSTPIIWLPQRMPPGGNVHFHIHYQGCNFEYLPRKEIARSILRCLSFLANPLRWKTHNQIEYMAAHQRLPEYTVP